MENGRLFISCENGRLEIDTNVFSKLKVEEEKKDDSVLAFSKKEILSMGLDGSKLTSPIVIVRFKGNYWVNGKNYEKNLEEALLAYGNHTFVLEANQ